MSSCGTTVQHEKPYRTHFTDYFGHVTFKEIPHPSIAHFYFELCPLIDNHNKDRQGILGLEDCWPTKSPWFWLVTTMIGMSVVDLHRWDWSKQSNVTVFEWLDESNEQPEFLVGDCASLARNQVERHHQQKLTQITNKEGQMCRLANGKKGGKGYVWMCLICQQ